MQMKEFEKLANAFRDDDVRALAQICGELVIPEDTLEFCKDCYVRKLVWSDPDIAIYILCWAPGQRSGIHDHPEKGCFMYLLKGRMTAINYNKHAYGAECSIRPGNWCIQTGTHQLHNMINGSERSISLHIYSPADYIPKFYDRPPSPSFWSDN